MSIIKLDDNTYFSTVDGVVVSKKDAQQLVQRAALTRRNLTIDQRVVKIDGKDTINIGLQLLTRDKTIEPKQGFLVQVFLSSSAGYTRLYKDEIVDPADLSTARGSFADYIDLEIDS